jgi:hypothetical protein
MKLLFKEHNKLIFFLFLLLVLFLFPTLPLRPVDVATGQLLEGYRIEVPFSAYLLEPLVGISQYFWRFSRVRFQTLSWLAWMILISLFLNRRKRRNMVRGVAKSILIFVLVCFFIILVPLPKYSLQSETSDNVLIDLHSHTTYSHEGLVTPEENIRWHLAHGFSVLAITDHPRVLEGAKRAREIAQKKYPQSVVIFGQEIKCYKDRRGQNFLLLGIDEVFDPRKYGREINRIIEVVHNKRGIVLVPHWWRAGVYDLQQLADAGVDGFEIYTARALGPEAGIRGAIRSVCRKNNRIMLGASNWHGWGSAAGVWSAIHIENWPDLNNEEKKGAILDALRNRRVDLFRVIILDRAESQDRIRYIFEPFVGSFYYFSSLEVGQLLSWMLWSGIFYFVFLFFKKKPVFLDLAVLGIGLLIFTKGFIFLNLWVCYLEYNEILFQLGNILLVCGTSFLIYGTLALLRKSNLKGLR